MHERHGDEEVGYLKLSPYHEAIKIGPVDSAEYRLISSLFGPAENVSRSSRFHSLFAPTERVYSSVTRTEPLSGVYVSSRMQNVINAAIGNVVDRIQKSEVGKYLAFTLTGRHLMMKIHPA
jgi:hypothetical protein